eukprot:c28433_g1_i1 orf=362-2386(-)
MDSRGGRRAGEDEDKCFHVAGWDGLMRLSPLVRQWMVGVLRNVARPSGFVRKKTCSAASTSFLHCSFCHRPLSVPVRMRPKGDCASVCSATSNVKDLYVNPLATVDGGVVVKGPDARFEKSSVDGASSRVSVDGQSSETLNLSFGDLSCEHGLGEDSPSSSDGSSPLRWPLQRDKGCMPGTPSMVSESTIKDVGAIWDEKTERREIDLSEIEMMKERFAKLLLGEDMSGSGKGVCTALAISNAITNLSASIFGELWRLEPLPRIRKIMWQREMEWFLAIADYMVELVPSLQTFPGGSTLEVMVSRPRSDLHLNLPALQKLDTMLLESLDSFAETEFCYVDQGIIITDEDNQRIPKCPLLRQDKWWLPSPSVPVNGLSDETRKHLQHRREYINQIHKASMAINNQVLLEMEVPDVYWEALPKNGKASLGEAIYRRIASEDFSPEDLLSSLDLSTEHSALEIVNCIEAAIHVWRCKRHFKQTQDAIRDTKCIPKTSWGIVRDLLSDMDRRELLAGRAEMLLFSLKQRFPGLQQTLLDITKIQYNRDVGQAILESYSRVMESLAFNIMSRIDDVLYVDDLAKSASLSNPHTAKICKSTQMHNFPHDLSVNSHTTSHVLPSLSIAPLRSPQWTLNSPLFGDTSFEGMASSFDKDFPDLMCLECSFRIDGSEDQYDKRS